MSNNLLLRLESCSQNPLKEALENFTTEVMAYLINEDPAFRRVFVRQIVGGGSLVGRFSDATAKTQQPFRNGIVDLVLLGKGSDKVLVEVKIGAQETWTKVTGRGWLPQVRKYLSYREGDVVLLSTKRVKSPAVESRRKRFRRSYLEDLYGRLNDRKERLTETGKMFLEFMEDRGMAPVKPFTKDELRLAPGAFSFALKCEQILKEIMDVIEPGFREMLRSRTSFTSAHFSPTYASAYCWSKHFRRGGVTRVWVWVEPWDSELRFGVRVNVREANSIRRLNRHLKWEESRTTLCASHPVQQGMSVQRMQAIVLRDLRRFQAGLAKVGS